jgi:hypothetical protein
MVAFQLPRYVKAKPLAGGLTGFYWECPALYVRQGCPWRAAALGSGLSQDELNEAAALWNLRLDEWRQPQEGGKQPAARYGTVAWLLSAYLASDSFLEHVDEYSRPDYRRIFERVKKFEVTQKDRASGRREVKLFGDFAVKAVPFTLCETIYKKFVADQALRSGEKMVTYMKMTWKRMFNAHPQIFRSDTPNPWEGVTVKRRVKAVKGFATREEVYRFAWGAVDAGRPVLAAAAVLCFEFLQRPSNVSAGLTTWNDYRSKSAPDKMRIRHRKNGEGREHPLEYESVDPITGKTITVPLFPEAEALLALVPRPGMSIVCNKHGKPYGNGTRLTQLVRMTADRLAMPGFTLDAARHGGMTELEEAELTEGQGRVLSAHKTSKAYSGYAKITEKRMMSAAKKRRGFVDTHSQPENSPTESTAKTG